MYRYYVYNKTRKSWHIIELNYDVKEKETVMVNYGSEDNPDICECEILRVMGKNNIKNLYLKILKYNDFVNLLLSHFMI